jgi:hypothetical protein
MPLGLGRPPHACTVVLRVGPDGRAWGAGAGTTSARGTTNERGSGRGPGGGRAIDAPVPRGRVGAQARAGRAGVSTASRDIAESRAGGDAVRDAGAEGGDVGREEEEDTGGRTRAGRAAAGSSRTAWWLVVRH